MMTLFAPHFGRLSKGRGNAQSKDRANCAHLFYLIGIANENCFTADMISFLEKNVHNYWSECAQLSRLRQT
jgi:hypothetical protein